EAGLAIPVDERLHKLGRTPQGRTSSHSFFSGFSVSASSGVAATTTILPFLSISTRRTAMPALTVALTALVTSFCLNVCWPRDIVTRFVVLVRPRARVVAQP